MSANDKVAATFHLGAAPTPTIETRIAEVVSDHSIGAFSGDSTACRCDRTWRKNAEHRAHATEALAAVLAPVIREQEAEAWGAGVATALNHAILNEDGITLRLEHLDGRPWANPYRSNDE